MRRPHGTGAVAEALDIETVLHAGAAPVLRYLLARLDTPGQAEELAQETMVRAFSTLVRGVRPQQPVPWLLGIARHVLLETWRGERSRRRLHERLAQAMGPSWAGAVEDVWPGGRGESSWQERTEHRLVVGEAVDGLPPELRAPVLLHYFADLPVARVAAQLGTTPGAIKMRLLRARLALRAELEDSEDERGQGQEDIVSGRRTTTWAVVHVRGPAERTPVYGRLDVGLEVGGRRYATDPLAEPTFSGVGVSLEDLRWATARLHAVRLSGPRPLAGELSFWAAPDPFEHPQPAAVWALLREAETAPPEFALIATDGWRLGNDSEWRPLLEGLRRAGLGHVWLTFTGLEATHDALCGRPGAFAAAVRALERARDAGLGVGANLLVSTRSTSELAELTRLVYSFRADPAGLRGVAVYVPQWSAVSPAYEQLRPEPEALAGLPPPDLAPYWRHEDFWADPTAFTEAALTRAVLDRPEGGAGGVAGAAANVAPQALGLLLTAGMDVLVGQPYAPPMLRVANLREDPPQRVYEALATLGRPPPPPPDAELAARYGDLQSQKVYPGPAGLRRKWIHAWRAEQGVPWLAL